MLQKSTLSEASNLEVPRKFFRSASEALWMCLGSASNVTMLVSGISSVSEVHKISRSMPRTTSGSLRSPPDITSVKASRATFC